MPVNSQTNATSTLEIKFTGLRNSNGLITIGINSSPEGWPRQPHMEPNWEKTNIENGVFTAKVENLAYGTYAVSVLLQVFCNRNQFKSPKGKFGSLW